MAGPWEKYTSQEDMKGPWANYSSNAMDLVDVKKPAQAFLEHYGNAATAGYLPHIQAVTEKLMPNPTAELDAKLRAQGTKIVQPESSYVESRDANIKRLAQQEKDNPTASALGTGTGIVANSILLNKFLPVASAKTAGQRILNAGKTGALIAGASNPGDTEGELNPFQPVERGINAAIGFGTGTSLQGAFEGGAKISKAGSDYFKRSAEEKAAKAAGFRLKDFNKANEQGLLQQHGRTLLDEGVVTAGASPSTIAERIGTKIGENETKLTGLIDGVEEKLSNQKFWNKLSPEDKREIIQASFRPKEEIGKIKDAIRSKYSEITDSKLKAALDEVDSWLAEKGKVMGIKSVQDMKVQMNRFLKDSDFWRQPASFAKEGTLAVRKSLKEGVEKKADALASVMGKNGGQIKSTNQKLGSLFEAEQAAQDRINRDAANRFLSPSDYGMGGLGAIIGLAQGNDAESRAKNALAGFTLAGGNKLARTYGPQVQAVAYDAIAKRLATAPQLARAAGQNPGITQGIAQAISGKMMGRGSFEENPSIQEFNPDTIDFYRKHPQLLDNVDNPKIRAQIKKEIERQPAAHNAVERRLKGR